MATASLSLPAARPQNVFLRQLLALAASFRWAIEVQRRCNQHSAGGALLDGDTVRRIMTDVDTLVART